MKKTILALVLAALCVMLLSACGAEKPAAQPAAAPSETAQESAAPAESSAPAYAKEIYLYNWSEYMTQEVLDGFEKEYGIKVIETTYESNDEMLAKLLAGSKGQYDIAVPSNFYIEARWISVSSRTSETSIPSSVPLRLTLKASTPCPTWELPLSGSGTPRSWKSLV